MNLTPFHRLLPAFAIALLLSSGTAKELTDDETTARKTAFDVAGAFSNDGFKLRDGTWIGLLQPKVGQCLRVNLFAGNQYWFSVGATPQAQKMSITIFDEAGKGQVVEQYAEGATAAAGFAPEASGPYLIRVEETEGAGPATFCLIYSYK